MNGYSLIKVVIGACVAGTLAQTAPANFNCGGPAMLAGSQFYQADREYTPANGAGSIGGQPYSLPAGIQNEPIEGSEFPALYSTLRLSPSGYVFDLPNGVYILTLDFVELNLSPPGARRFSISAEGTLLLGGLDIARFVGKHYALRYRSLVRVADGQLNVVFHRLAGEPAIAAIGVLPARIDGSPPSVPGVSALGSYNRNVLNWPSDSVPDLAGYLVYRSASASGPFTRITPAPLPFSRYLDDAVTPGQTSYYRVSSVDVYGNESFPSLPVAARTRSKTQSTLPVYEITLPPDSLAALYADPFSDEYVDGDFRYQSDLYPDIGVRFRGNISRNYSKKSWRVNFKSSKPFEGKDKLNIKASPLDASMIRECLAAFLLKPLALFSGDCSFVHLQLNSEFLGVFSRVEIPDEDFLRARGLDPAGKLFEAEHPVLGNFSVLPDYDAGWEDDSQNSDGFGALSEFIDLINSTPDNSFATTIASVFNVDAWLDYYAALMLISNFDHTGHNYYAYRDPNTLMWELFPKDHDTAFYISDLPFNYGTRAAPDRTFGHHNVLADRILSVPLFRQWYVNKALELIVTDFTSFRMNLAAGTYHWTIREDALLDVYKRGRESNDVFLTSTEQITHFIEQRRAFAQRTVPDLSPGLAQPVVLNEIVTNNVSGIRDEASEFDEWIELFNKGTTPYNLTGHSLAANPRTGTKWRFPAGTTIPPQGHLLVWVDGQPSQGPLHTSFALNAAGGTVSLFGPVRSGTPLLDVIAYRALPSDVSYGRRFSGSSLWRKQTPTAGTGNL